MIDEGAEPLGAGLARQDFGTQPLVGLDVREREPLQIAMT